MPQHRVVISISGGLLTDVLTNVPDVEIILVDWDLDAYDEERTKHVEFDCQGQHYKVFVEDFPFEKLPTSPLSFVSSALEAAGRKPLPDPPQP